MNEEAEPRTRQVYVHARKTREEEEEREGDPHPRNPQRYAERRGERGQAGLPPEKMKRREEGR